MAAPAANSVAALAATSFGGGDNTPSSCVDDPNFATICSFIQNFGEIIRIGRIPFDDLQKMLENSADVPPPLAQLHIVLLRRVFKTVTPDKWERSLAKFGHTYCSQDAWEIERFGYKKTKIQTKLRLLKNLLEAQFDYNVKFKAEVNKLQASDLRLNPLGRDTEGQVYWYQVDEDANLRVYREDVDDETWEIVASNRDELEELISQLQRGEVKKPEPEEAIIVPEEDSNSKDDIEPKEIILDTGKVEDEGSGSNAEISSESDEGDDNKQEKRTVEPLIIKHSFNIHKIHTASEVENVKSDVDKVQNEVSSESEPKVPGIKLVFGVKSTANPENSQPNPEAPHVDMKKPTEETAPSSGVVEAISSAKWSICTSTALPQTDIVPKSEPSEKTIMYNVDECKVRKSDMLETTPKQVEKEVPTPKQMEKVVPTPKQIEKLVPTPKQMEKMVPAPKQIEKELPTPKHMEKVVPTPSFETKETNKNVTLRNELSLSTSFQARELLNKTDKNRQRHSKVSSTSIAPPQTDIVPKSEPSEKIIMDNVDDLKVRKSDTLEVTPKQVEKSVPPCKQIDNVVPTYRQIEKETPSHRQIEKETPSHRQIEKETPPHKQIEKETPPHRQIEKEPPSHRRIEKETPSHRQIEKEPPPPRQNEKGTPPPRQIEKETPSHRQIEKEPPPPRQNEKGTPPPRQIEKGTPPPRQTEKLIPPPKQTEKLVPTHRETEKLVSTHKQTEKLVPTHKETEKPAPTHKQLEIAVPTPQQIEKSLPTPKQIEKEVSAPKPIETTVTTSPIDTKKNVTFMSNELSFSSSVHQRELQTKANKIRQKSAKVNSILERLSKKLPENSAKTVADLIPPPKITKSETATSQQKQTPENIPAIQKSEAKAPPSKDNKLLVTEIETPDKLPVSQDVSVDINVKIVQSKAMDLTSTSIEPYESPIVKKALHVNDNITCEVEKVSMPKVEKTQSSSSSKNPRNEAIKESITSISSEPLEISQKDIIIKESNTIIKGLSSGSNETSSVIPRNNRRELRAHDASIMPEKKSVKDSSHVQPMAVVEEEIIEKKEAWICGKQENPVKEELVIKESTWVCGVPVKSAHDKDHVRLDLKGALKSHRDS